MFKNKTKHALKTISSSPIDIEVRVLGVGWLIDLIEFYAVLEMALVYWA